MTSNPFDRLAEQVERHSSYGPAVQAAAREGTPLVLDYHTHSPDSDYCVSICALVESPIKLLGEDELQELAHIRGFGDSEDECEPRCLAFADALRDRFEIDGDIRVYLNGQPR